VARFCVPLVEWKGEQSMTDQDKTEVRKAFRKSANMTPARLTNGSTAGKANMWAGKARTAMGPGESVGHRSGRRIVAIKRKRAADLTEADYTHMRKEIGYVARHSAQRPSGQIRRSD
jgi:hypothetical protein